MGRAAVSDFGNGLTEKQLKFANAYIENGRNGTQAVKTAGYKDKGFLARKKAYIVKNKPAVKKYIEERMKSIQEGIEVTIDWKIKKLKCLVDAGLGEDENGMPVILNHQAVLGAITELNKMQGHHAAQKVVTANFNAEIDRDDLDALLSKYEREY